MSITIKLWIIPTIMTVALLCVMLRPYRSCGACDFGAIFRLFWLLPIAAVWVIYMGIQLWCAK